MECKVSCRLENARLYLEWSFLAERQIGCHGNEIGQCHGSEWNPTPIIHLRLTDHRGDVVLECRQSLAEEEPLRSVLLQPRLWNGVADPYRYQLEVFLLWGCSALPGEEVADHISRLIPLRVLEMKSAGPSGQKEVSLNGTRVMLKAVRYTGRESQSGGELNWQKYAEQLVGMGANCIVWESPEKPSERVVEFCEQAGLLLCGKSGDEGDIAVDEICDGESLPEICGGAKALFDEGTGTPTALYYRYKAEWTAHSFVYIVPESIQKLKSGNYRVTCYSNCNRVALYSDGILFEFQKGEGEFVFWEVPAKSPCLLLAAEGDGCATSFSVHKTFTNLSRNGDK